ncbi:hypothetical protein ACO2Q0_11875 [Phenylobacterium sp. VNQ135]|uniref:hypothetical protein n=1 Tax=Phenylobacterium sp. VNQ135 TaxID=3400922 RepID=UPI003C052CBD
MSNSESVEPTPPEAGESHPSPHDEAQRAADGLKDQIAAVRDRIRQARDALTEHARRENEGRSFKK